MAVGDWIGILIWLALPNLSLYGFSNWLLSCCLLLNIVFRIAWLMLQSYLKFILENGFEHAFWSQVVAVGVFSCELCQIITKLLQLTLVLFGVCSALWLGDSYYFCFHSLNYQFRPAELFSTSSPNYAPWFRYSIYAWEPVYRFLSARSQLSFFVRFLRSSPSHHHWCNFCTIWDAHGFLRELFVV